MDYCSDCTKYSMYIFSLDYRSNDRLGNHVLRGTMIGWGTMDVLSSSSRCCGHLLLIIINIIFMIIGFIVIIIIIFKAGIARLGESGCTVSVRRPQPQKANPQKKRRERENSGRQKGIEQLRPTKNHLLRC